MLKLTRLFFSSTEDDSFLQRIVPSDIQRKTLADAKNDIRDHLRVGIREATIKLLGMDKAVTPRFRTQGSWSYRTCVQPAWLPPQEMDWDFGVYLPVTVWEENGPPHVMAKKYFDLVEGLLASLCEEKGWSLVPGKHTCIRVQISSWAHIDLPLYAAPEAEFTSIMEKAALAGLLRKSADGEYFAEAGEEELYEQEWANLDCIVLATRSGEWKQSDPEAVSKWYLDKVLEHTEQLRRVCHYIKAWRDHQWKDGGGPSSVAIMIAVAQKFEQWRGRDDKALEQSARALALALIGDIRELGIDKGAEDFNRLSPSERTQASKAAEALAAQLQHARMQHAYNGHVALAAVTAQFGVRVPDRLDLIEADAADDVRTVPARTVVAPVVPATKAG